MGSILCVTIGITSACASVTVPKISDSRWEKTPNLHNNIIKDKDAELMWRFRDQPCDKAEVTVIHAPPDLHYEYSVVSEKVQLQGPEKDLHVYYHHFVGRVKVTYHHNTVSVRMSKCVPEDAGEVFVQVHFPGSVPLTSSTYLSVYEEPIWVLESISSETMGENVRFSISSKHTELTPPIDKVIVENHAINLDGQNQTKGENDTIKTMTITPPTIKRGLELRWQPLDFHRDLRYIGNADLHHLQYIIPKMVAEKEGLFTIKVVFGLIDKVLTQTMTIKNSTDTATKPKDYFKPEVYLTTTSNYDHTVSECTPQPETCSRGHVIALSVISSMMLVGILGALLAILRLRKRQPQRYVK